MAPTAHLLLIHPQSASSRDTLVTKSASASPSSLSTRVIFTPATRPKANLGMVPASETSTMFGVMEIGTTSSASSFEGASVDASEWTPATGFLARQGEKQSPRAGIVMLAKFVLREGENLDANRAGLVGVLGSFCSWVEHNEPGTLTYSVFTSASHPTEVLMFERYKDLPALGVHGKTDQFKAMFRGTGKFIQGKKTVLSEWEEKEGSFVTRLDGMEKAKL